MDLLGFVLFGIVVGFYSSFSGLGGGFLIMPLMVALGYDIKTAVATSLFVIILTAGTGVIGAWAKIEWRVALLLAAGAIVVGAPLGTIFKEYASNDAIRKTLAAVSIVIAAELIDLEICGVKMTISNLISHLVRAFSFQ